MNGPELKRLAAEISAAALPEFARPVQEKCADLNDYLLRYVQGSRGPELSGQLAALEKQTAALAGTKKKSVLQRLFFFWRRNITTRRETLARLHRSEAEIERIEVKLRYFARLFEEDRRKLAELSRFTEEALNELSGHTAALEHRLGGLGPYDTALGEACRERLHELMMTEAVLRQTAVQIAQLLRNNDTICQKISHAAGSIIPLWKQLIVSERTQKAEEAETASRLTSSLHEIGQLLKDDSKSVKKEA